MFRISRKYTQNMKLIREAHTYYDILRLKPNCTQKEIRESFIKLSKEHHPDTNLTLESTRKFQKILEAYQVLGKADTRGTYDAELRMNTPHSTTTPHPHSFYRDFNAPDAPGEAGTNQDYYGLKGVKKVSNYVIVVLCLIFAEIGVALQILAIRSSMTFKREKLDLQSSETSHQHTQVKDDASKYGNELQLKRLRDKLRE